MRKRRSLEVYRNLDSPGQVGGSLFNWRGIEGNEGNDVPRLSPLPSWALKVFGPRMLPLPQLQGPGGAEGGWPPLTGLGTGWGEDFYPAEASPSLPLWKSVLSWGVLVILTL